MKAVREDPRGVRHRHRIECDHYDHYVETSHQHKTTYLKQATFGTPHRHIGIILIAKHVAVVVMLRRL
jgi:hypothetical protein